MSKTLARSIRRIGLLPTTYVEMTEQRLTRAVDGTETTHNVTIRRPVRHREALTLEELEERRAALITAARAARKTSRRSQ